MEESGTAELRGGIIWSGTEGGVDGIGIPWGLHSVAFMGVCLAILFCQSLLRSLKVL